MKLGLESLWIIRSRHGLFHPDREVNGARFRASFAGFRCNFPARVKNPRAEFGMPGPGAQKRFAEIKLIAVCSVSSLVISCC